MPPPPDEPSDRDLKPARSRVPTRPTRRGAERAGPAASGRQPGYAASPGRDYDAGAATTVQRPTPSAAAGQSGSPRPDTGATAVLTTDGGGFSAGRGPLPDAPLFRRRFLTESSSPGMTLAERVGLPTLATPPALLSLPGERPFDPATAKRQGPYLLGEVLGEGGMGQVIAARDEDMGRLVALKTLKEDGREDPNLVRALLFEARIHGQLEHPNIVPVHELGRLGDGRVFYTMKLVGDLSLKDVLAQLADGNEFAQRTYTLSRMLQYFRGICMAMEYAHARGVVHRDVKPDNVLIGDYGEVQIMDWGIARVLPQGPERPGYFAGLQEQEGVIAGTPHYMAPEQARGETLRVDARSDVYALGVILYQILTNTLPHDVRTSDDQLEAVKAQPIQPPSKRAPHKDVPPELERICMKAMAYEPDDRHNSARELWDDVESFVEGRREEERLNELAREQLVVADEAAQRYYDVRREVAQLDAVVRTESLAASTFDPLPARKAAWDRKLEADHLHLTAARAFAEAVAGYEQVLAHRSEHAPARQALSGLYRSASEDAMGRGDHAGAVLYSDLARTSLPTEERSHANAALRVRSYPEGARIRIVPMGTDGRSGAPIEAGVAPVTDLELPPGIYLVSAELPGYRETRLPAVLHAGTTSHEFVTLTPWTADVPLFGRSDEVTALKETLTSVVAHDKLVSLFVTGEVGAGKNKVLEEFDAYVDALPDVYIFTFARCQPTHRRVPFQAAAEVIRHRAGIRAGASPEEMLASLEQAVEYAFTGGGLTKLRPEQRLEVRRIARVIATMPGLCGRDSSLSADIPDGAEGTVQLFEAIAAYFGAIASHDPLILVLIGAEHLDRLTRDLLRYLGRALRDKPILFLALATSDTLGLGADRTIRLRPLDREDIRHQLTVMLKGPVSPRIVEFVHAKSEGNAFRILELARVLVTTYRTRWNGREWDFAPARPGEPDVTELDMKTLLELPLASLAARDLEVLRHAVVSGGRFWVEAIQHALGRPVDREIDELVDREIIVPLPTSRFPGTRQYRLRDPNLRAMLYETIADADRHDAHLRLAWWLRTLGSSSATDRALEALHLIRGGRPEEAEPVKQQLRLEASRWERPDGPDWFAWPEERRSGLVEAD